MGDTTDAMYSQIIERMKASGVFDQFRKECIADVDTKPAYINLHTRVVKSVNDYLKNIPWSSKLLRISVRDGMRKQIVDSSYFEKGVDRIVNQAVDPKINNTFFPHVENAVYEFLGLQKPKPGELQEETEEDKKCWEQPMDIDEPQDSSDGLVQDVKPVISDEHQVSQFGSSQDSTQQPMNVCEDELFMKVEVKEEEETRMSMAGSESDLIIAEEQAGVPASAVEMDEEVDDDEEESPPFEAIGLTSPPYPLPGTVPGPRTPSPPPPPPPPEPAEEKPTDFSHMFPMPQKVEAEGSSNESPLVGAEPGGAADDSEKIDKSKSSHSSSSKDRSSHKKSSSSSDKHRSTSKDSKSSSSHHKGKSSSSHRERDHSSSRDKDKSYSDKERSKHSSSDKSKKDSSSKHTSSSSKDAKTSDSKHSSSSRRATSSSSRRHSSDSRAKDSGRSHSDSKSKSSEEKSSSSRHKESKDSGKSGSSSHRDSSRSHSSKDYDKHKSSNSSRKSSSSKSESDQKGSSRSKSSRDEKDRSDSHRSSSSRSKKNDEKPRTETFQFKPPSPVTDSQNSIPDQGSPDVNEAGLRTAPGLHTFQSSVPDHDEETARDKWYGTLSTNIQTSSRSPEQEQDPFGECNQKYSARDYRGISPSPETYDQNSNNSYPFSPSHMPRTPPEPYNNSGDNTQTSLQIVVEDYNSNSNSNAMRTEMDQRSESRTEYVDSLRRIVECSDFRRKREHLARFMEPYVSEDDISVSPVCCQTEVSIEVDESLVSERTLDILARTGARVYYSGN